MKLKWKSMHDETIWCQHISRGRLHIQGDIELCIQCQGWSELEKLVMLNDKTELVASLCRYIFLYGMVYVQLQNHSYKTKF